MSAQIAPTIAEHPGGLRTMMMGVVLSGIGAGIASLLVAVASGHPVAMMLPLYAAGGICGVLAYIGLLAQVGQAEFMFGRRD